MSSTVTLSQDTLSNLSGINLKWVYANLGAAREVSLIYYENTPTAEFMSAELPSGNVKYNISSGLTSGSTYSFQLQVTDTSGLTVYSNTLIVTAPYFLVAPSISSITGQDAALAVYLAASSNIMSSSDTTVEFVLKRDDNVAIWIVKPFSSSGFYVLSNSDDNRLVNNVSYRVAAMFQPSASNSRYSVASPISASISATPSNIPNAPQNVTVQSVGTAKLDVRANWGRPSDFAEWSSSGFTITLKLISGLGVVLVTKVYTNQDVTSHTWYDNAQGFSFSTSVKYGNQFGFGPVVQSDTIVPTSVPSAVWGVQTTNEDSATTLSWNPVVYDGQTPVTSYTIQRNGIYYASVPVSDPTSLHITGLINGTDYTFQVFAINAIGQGLPSASSLASPYGLMTIASAVVNGKILTVTITPNGRPVESLFLIAIDQDPDDKSDGTFIAEFTQQQIPQNRMGSVVVVKNFSTFSSSISKYVAIAHTFANTASLAAM